MSYVNTGAYVNGERPKTKTALRLAVMQQGSVVFDHTEAFGPNAGSSTTVEQLPVGVTLVVTGPCPYTKRNWYANVTRTSDGKVTVK